LIGPFSAYFVQPFSVSFRPIYHHQRVIVSLGPTLLWALRPNYPVFVSGHRTVLIIIDISIMLSFENCNLLWYGCIAGGFDWRRLVESRANVSDEIFHRFTKNTKIQTIRQFWVYEYIFSISESIYVLVLEFVFQWMYQIIMPI